MNSIRDHLLPTRAACVSAVMLVLATSANGELPDGKVATNRSAVLDGFELEATIKVEVTGNDTHSYSAVYGYSSIAEAGRYRFETVSRGDRVGLLEGLAVAFDGQQTWLRIPASKTTTVRAGEIEERIPFPLPDPITLQYRSLVALADIAAARHVSILDLIGDRSLRASLDDRARVVAAGVGRPGEAVAHVLDSDPDRSLELELRRVGGEWVPAAFTLVHTGARSARMSWVVLEFLDPGRAGGVHGVPAMVRYEAIDPSQALSRLVARYDVTLFRPVRSVPARRFVLDPPMTDAIYDEDARAFIRSGSGER